MDDRAVQREGENQERSRAEIRNPFRRLYVIWIVAIVAIVIAVAAYSFTQVSQGLERVVTWSDARKTARETLVTLLDQEVALRYYTAAKRRPTINAYRAATALQQSLDGKLRGYVGRLDHYPTSRDLREFEAASTQWHDRVNKSLLADRDFRFPAAGFNEITVCRQSLNALIGAFNSASKNQVAGTKLRIFLAGLVAVGSTILFGAAVLVVEELRRRAEQQRAIERESTIIERERANLAVMRADALEAAKAAIEREVLERRQVEERFAFAALHDPLTGLANRALVMDRLLQIAVKRYSTTYQWAILFLDLDRFKVVNDSLGHIAGDLLLIEVARRLECCLRGGDTLARFGGDEFIIVVDDIHGEQAACAVAARIMRVFDSAFTLAGREVFLSVSIGIATSLSSDDRPEDLIRNADIAMYRAKELGRQRFELFTPELLTRAVTLLEVQTDLTRALDHNEFCLHYQPIVSLRDGGLIGFEALVRWQHPRRGLLGPDQFIGLAEETGAIVAIGDWILREACRQMQSWRATLAGARDLRMNVNVSPKQFTTDFARTVESALLASGLSPDGLNLEITESVVINDANIARAALMQLRALGVHVHLDDFGTGYSSLAYVHNFPIDALKIDRSFVSSSGAGLANIEIIRAIIALAQSLSLTVTAEGVETQEQYEQLRALGCTNGQGYYFSRPVDAQDTFRQLLFELGSSDGGADVEGRVVHLGANERSNLSARRRRDRVGGAPAKASA
jgi:diguanylate cyclase (GGDEF)-like protein